MPAGLPHDKGSRTGRRPPTRHRPAPPTATKPTETFSCPCGTTKSRYICRKCGAKYCAAPGHAKHVCEVA